MIVSKTPPLHLTYCQNIHPGETWLEHYQALSDKAVAVKTALGVEHPFGLGLRLSATAATQLQSPAALEQGRSLFQDRNLYPFSINGFPYGRFHRGPVKSDVYAPDWRTPERVQYTNDLGKTLAFWLPEGIEGSISTVPGSYAPWIKSREDELAMARNLGSTAAAFATLENHTGRRVHLGLEPEPDCFLETTAQTLAFFKNTLPEGAIPEIRRALGCSDADAEALLRRHIGVCFDTCHVALQYENLAASLRAFREAGVLLSKIQLSAALRAPATADTCAALGAFREPVYLHQVKALAADGTVRSWPDLAEALEALPSSNGLEELRVHFHVPLFVSPNAPLASTASALDEDFWKEVRSGVCPHLEIETYTFDVLPPEVHPGDIVKSITEEYRWVLQKLTR
jgi:sugar phosphate isomerase/epimerase